MRYISKKEFDSRMRKIQFKNKQLELRNELKAEKNKFKQSKKDKMKTSNIVLVSAIIAIVLFTIVCLYIQYHIGTEVSSTLITLWFGFWTVEILSLAGIKVSKVFKNYEHMSGVDDVEQVDSNKDTDAVG